MYLVSGVSHPVVYALPYPIPVDALHTTYHMLCSLLSLIRKVYTVRKAIEEQRDAMLLPSLSVDALFLATCYPVPPQMYPTPDWTEDAQTDGPQILVPPDTTSLG